MCKPVMQRAFDASLIGERPEQVPDGARVEVVPVPPRSISKAKQVEARRWWRKVNGLPVKAGRHPGAEYWTDARIVDALHAYRDANGGKTPGLRKFVMWAHEQVVPESEQPDGGLDEGVAATLGTRWNKRLGMSPADLAKSFESGVVWIVEEEVNTDDSDP